MTILRQRIGDGEYYFITRLYSGPFVTWHFREGGVAYLNQLGIQVGDEFDQSVFNQLKHQNLIYSGGGGVDYDPLVPAFQVPNYNVPLLSLRIKNDEWSPAILFPELPGNWKPDPAILGSCSLQVNGSIDLAALKLWPGKGGASVEVPPQEQPYKTVPRGAWPRRWDMSRWLGETPGLASRGTIFGVGENDPLRLENGKGIALGSTYFFVVNPKAGKNRQGGIPTFPPTLRHIRMKSRGNWTAWQLDMPSTPDDDLRKWAEHLGFHLILPPWKVAVLSPPPYSYSVHGLPRLRTGQKAVFAMYPPSEAKTSPLELKMEYLSESGKITKEIGTFSINKSVPQFILANMDEPGTYSIHASTGQLIPITVKVDSIIDSDASSLQTIPLTVNVGSKSQLLHFVAFIDELGPHQITIQEENLRQFKIDIECPTPITVRWERQGRVNRREKIVTKRFWQEAHADLISALENAEPFLLEIDGGNYGRFILYLSLAQEEIGREPSKAAIQMATWLRMVLPHLLAQKDTRLVQIPPQVRTALQTLEGGVTSMVTTETIPVQALPYFWFLVREIKS